MAVPSALAAIRSRRFLIGRWPWWSLGFVISTVPLAAAVAVPFGVLAAPWLVLLRRLTTGEAGLLSSLLLFLGGAGLLAGIGPLVARPLPAVERLRVRLADDRVITPARSPWRRLAYAVVLVTAVPVVYGALGVAVLLIGVSLLSPWLVGDGPVSYGFVTLRTSEQALPYAVGGLIALVAVPYLVALVAGAHAAVARAILHTAPTEELRAELVEVSRSRARMAGAFESERRRIERDLHDGAQQKLVGLTLQLGLARLDVPDDSPAAGPVDAAHRQAKELMAELRELIHGIRPQLLTDLGLPAALRDLAGNAPVPVTVTADLPGRLPAHVEATAYFVAAEALANVAKHSAATSGAIAAYVRERTLIMEVRDDGRGGADPARGTGLTGLADRVAVADGRMLLASPAGGPTVLRVEVPCA